MAATGAPSPRTPNKHGGGTLQPLTKMAALRRFRPFASLAPAPLSEMAALSFAPPPVRHFRPAPRWRRGRPRPHGTAPLPGPGMTEEAARRAVAAVPLLRTAAGPRDRERWAERLKEEYRALIQYVEHNKAADNDWFRLESNAEGTRWTGRCWHIHELLKYEFAIEFEIPVTYPSTAPEIAIPELDGKTAKMYRGGKICLSDHFKPLWARNVPKFGLAHLMALGLGPWLAVEIPDLVAKGLIEHKEK